jgi:hypothetical protein
MVTSKTCFKECLAKHKSIRIVVNMKKWVRGERKEVRSASKSCF